MSPVTVVVSMLFGVYVISYIRILDKVFKVYNTMYYLKHNLENKIKTQQK